MCLSRYFKLRFMTSWQTMTKEPNSDLAKLCDPEAILSQPAVFKVYKLYSVALI
jgi:hypothetical protein